MLSLDFKELLRFKDEYSFRECQKKADKGCAESQLIVAKSFLSNLDSLGIQNTWFGMEYLFKSSLFNDDAKIILAKIYSNGALGNDKVLILKDRSYAYSLINQLAATGNIEAEELLADIYSDSSYFLVHGMDKEYCEVLSFLYYEKAGASGKPSANYKLAMMFKSGIGTKKSIGMAKKTLILAAENGYLPAIKELESNNDLYLSGN